MNEKQAFDKVINILTEHNLTLSRDYVIKNYNNGCFYIQFCEKQFILLDVMYFYEMIPDITIFKIKYSNKQMFLNIKIRLRE